VEDADEGTNEVVRVGVRAEIAASDSAFNRGHEGGVDEGARAFHEAHGAAGDRVHRGNDEFLARNVVDEKQHPGAEGFERRHVGGEALLGGGEFFNFAAVDGSDEGIAGRKVAIERARTDACLASDIVKAGGSSVARKDLLGDF